MAPLTFGLCPEGMSKSISPWRKKEWGRTPSRRGPVPSFAPSPSPQWARQSEPRRDEIDLDPIHPRRISVKVTLSLSAFSRARRACKSGWSRHFWAVLPTRHKGVTASKSNSNKAQIFAKTAPFGLDRPSNRQR